jgi:hypothetical protein
MVPMLLLSGIHNQTVVLQSLVTKSTSFKVMVLHLMQIIPTVSTVCSRILYLLTQPVRLLLINYFRHLSLMLGAQVFQQK